MFSINLKNYPGAYKAATKTFSMSEKGIPFGTSYELHNPDTGGKIEVEFSHSTGSEWDPKTIYVWKSKDKEYTLELHNDKEITEQRAAAYLAAKTRRA